VKKRKFVHAALLIVLALTIEIAALGFLPSKSLAAAIYTQDQQWNLSRDKSQKPRAFKDIIAEVKLPHNATLRVGMHDFESGKYYDFNDQDSMEPASFIKTLYMIAFLEEASKGKQDLKEIHTLRDSDKHVKGTKVEGPGPLKHKDSGFRLRGSDLLSLMITEDDDIAANMLLNTIGIGCVQRKTRKYNLQSTKVNRRMWEITHPRPNQTSIRDMTKLLVMLGDGKVLNGEMHQRAVGLMTMNRSKNRIGKYSPSEVIIANMPAGSKSMAGGMALVYFRDRKPMALTIVIESSNNKDLDIEKCNEIIALLAKNLIENYY